MRDRFKKTDLYFDAVELTDAELDAGYSGHGNYLVATDNSTVTVLKKTGPSIWGEPDSDVIDAFKREHEDKTCYIASGTKRVLISWSKV